jgi:hypothetical protein
MNEPSNSHTVRIEVIGNYQHGGRELASVVVGGDGGLDHLLMAFKAALLAAGYSESTVGRIRIINRHEKLNNETVL